MRVLDWFRARSRGSHPLACWPAACLAGFLLAAALPATSANAPPLPLDNVRSPYLGEPFFLLSDATFGSAATATVRLEVNQPQALESVGGVDIVVYRIAEPLDFLQRQKNLHRVQVDSKPAGEGLSNTLTHLWDSWVVKSRLAWRQIFSPAARGAVVRQAPALKTKPAFTAPSTFEEPPRFKPLPGLPVVERFRYPVHAAKPIDVPKDLKLAGSSSEFINPAQGNVFVPVGRRAPGLYLVEAIAGEHRATTMLFVSDTVALTKVSTDQMLVWAVGRGNGAPVPQTRVVWTDGVGVLKSGAADSLGIVRLDRKSPEQTYVFGQDPAGGVFISENFYDDSEIYASKVYTVTDRPLYRAGDWVNVRTSGREFRSARESVALKDAELVLTVLDPAGQAIHTQSLHFSGADGAQTRFALPDNAPAGGYELRLAMDGEVYNAAFRVADYQKPHFEIGIVADKTDYATGDAIGGKLQLNYPDGKPVANARVSLTARAQQLSMVDGELDYAGQFPVKLTQTDLQTDASGVAKFALPPAAQPSRVIVTALATDGAAYRVRTTKEILVERGGATFRLTPDRQFSRPGESVAFRLSAGRAVSTSANAAVGALGASADASTRPASWEALRLENRAKSTGAVPAGDVVTIPFAQPGSYSVSLRDAKGRIVGAASHWVSGDGVKAPIGSIGMVFDRARYRAGDTASVLVSFPEPVDDALLTLERDRVEAVALMGRRADWVTSERIAPAQWKFTLPVRDAMSPNMTFSVAYVKNGDYVFQNQGLIVEQPRIAIAFKTDKPVYEPGQTVNVDVATTLAGRPLAADVTVSVVDEMIYVLQPEIAPSIDDFFYHPRRDNVRTSASLSFIGYDLATSKLGSLPSSRQVNQRAVKVLERPRRDNVDTAAWQPRLVTDASGHARFSFKMPDSLTRWRITGRALDANGVVGQQVGWVRSDKPFFAKWTSPDWQREGDRAQASIAIFNQTGQSAKLEWEARGADLERRDSVTVQPGANFVALPLAAATSGSADIAVALRQDGRVVDRLEVALRRVPVGWRGPRELTLDLQAGQAALKLPPDATRVRVAFAQDPAAGAFNRALDDLIDFPFGCTEQTASRMLPLSMALQSLGVAQQGLAPLLTQRLMTARTALAQLAGPNAQFGWWGRGMASDAFLTTYAYYADWRATNALHTPLPDENWQRLLDVYAKQGQKLPAVQRALMLWWMNEMGLPVGALAGRLVEQLLVQGASDPAQLGRQRASLLMVDGDLPVTRDFALVLAAATAAAARAAPSAAQRTEIDASAVRLAKVELPLVQALLLATGRSSADKAGAVLAQVRADAPTLDRAQALVWIAGALGRRPDAADPARARAALPAPWQRSVSAGGDSVWQWPARLALPPSLGLPAALPAAWAFVSYESGEAQAATLPAQVERSLWRVVPLPRSASAAKKKAAEGSSRSDSESASPAGSAAGSESSAASADAGRLTVKLERVAPGTALDTDTLYVDQIEVASERPLRWALLEAALPPGAAVEGGTWGIDVSAAGAGPQPLEAARHQPTAQGYAVPIDALRPGAPALVRHLVRFAQRGTFKLPPARLYRMYEPDAKAYERSGAWAAVEVR